MIQALLSKYLLPVAGLSILALGIGLAYQSWRVESKNTEIERLEKSVASQKATIDALKSAEILGRKAAKRATADKAVREKELARHLNFIEGKQSNARIDPMLSDTIKRLYTSP